MPDQERSLMKLQLVSDTNPHVRDIPAKFDP